MYYNCEGTLYALRAPMDLPPRLVELFEKANLPVPKVRAYIENNHIVWRYFFPEHYCQTWELRRSDPTANLPLPGHINEQDDDEVHDFWSCLDWHVFCSICANSQQAAFHYMSHNP